MNYKKITVAFIVVTAAVIAAFDVWVIQAGGVEASISYTIINWTYSFPAFTFMLGYLMGHLTWVIRGRVKK